MEWDPGKPLANLRKHGVRFADAAIALQDPVALTIRDPSAEHEDRWITIGVDGAARALVVVYTWRGESIRIISARQATPRERRQYEGQV